MISPESPRSPHEQIHKKEMKTAIDRLECFLRSCLRGVDILTLFSFLSCVYVYLYKEEIGKNLIGQAECDR